MIGSILLVLGLADRTRGSKRWIELPFFQFQPSEIGKLLLVVALSGFIVDRMRRMGRDVTARIMLLALLPAMLVMAQPDLGTALVYVVGVLALLFIAGAPWRHFAALRRSAPSRSRSSSSLRLRWASRSSSPTRCDRLTAFLNPSGDPGTPVTSSSSPDRYRVGREDRAGVDNATQTGLNFLPEHHTDFIFAVVGETYGFAGAALVLSLYALLIWRGLHILTVAKNLYGALLAGGITAMLLFQIFVNVGMTVGIMPITGVPAPLLSFGGSSMLVTFLAIGLLQSVHAQARDTAARKGRATVF